MLADLLSEIFSILLAVLIFTIIFIANNKNKKYTFDKNSELVQCNNCNYVHKREETCPSCGSRYLEEEPEQKEE